MNNNSITGEAGNLNNNVEEKSEKEIIVPNTLVGRSIVNCPITGPAHSVVEVDFCKKKCNWFKKVIEGSTEANRIECSYPRFIEIIDVCGERK